MSGAEYFLFPPERTLNTDELYSAFGRAVSYCTSFEKQLSAFIGFLNFKLELKNNKSKDIYEIGLITFNKLYKQNMKRKIDKLNKIIKDVIGYSDFYEILNDAREARNFIIHDLSISHEEWIINDNNVDNFINELKMLIEKIAKANYVIVIFICALTNEDFPIIGLTNYLRHVEKWVIGDDPCI